MKRRGSEEDRDGAIWNQYTLPDIQLKAPSQTSSVTSTPSTKVKDEAQQEPHIENEVHARTDSSSAPEQRDDISPDTQEGSEEWIEGFWEEDSHADTDMLQEEKQAMYDAVTEGNVDLLDDLLDKPGADINMIWFDENLLMAAIRAGEQTMAEFLLDNGVDRNFTATRMEKKTPKNGEVKVDLYSATCRQMAYDAKLTDIVDLIDEMSGEAWSFHKPRERVVRKKRPLVEKVRETHERCRTTASWRSSLYSAGLSRSYKSAKPGTDGGRAPSLQTVDGASSLQKTSISAMLGDTGYDSLSVIDSVMSAPEALSLDNLRYPIRSGPHYRSNKTAMKRYKTNRSHMASRNDEDVLNSMHQALHIPQRIYQRQQLEDDDPFGPEEIDKLYAQHSEQWAVRRRNIPSIVSQPNDSAKHSRKSASFPGKDSQPKRIVSPWKADNVKIVGHLERRAQSAPSSVAKAKREHPEPTNGLLAEEINASLPVIDRVVRCQSGLYQTKYAAGEKREKSINASRPNTNASRRREWNFEGMENYLSSDHFKQSMKNKDNLKRTKDKDGGQSSAHRSPRICKQNWPQLLHNAKDTKVTRERKKKLSPAGLIKTTAAPLIQVTEA